MGRWWASMTGALIKSSSHEIFHLVRHIKDSFCGCSANWTEWNQSSLLLLSPSHKSWVCPPPPTPPPSPPPLRCLQALGFVPVLSSRVCRHTGARTQHGAVLRLPETKVHVLWIFVLSMKLWQNFFVFCFLFLNQLLSKLFLGVSAAVIEAEHVWSTNMFSLLFCDQRFFFFITYYPFINDFLPLGNRLYLLFFSFKWSFCSILFQYCFTIMRISNVYF